jgi:hypothetical protein
MRYTSLNTIPSKHTYTDILAPEKPKTQEILVPNSSTPAITQPAADINSKGGHSGGGISAGQLKDGMGSSDENEDDDENEDNAPVAIDKSKKTSFTWEMAGHDGNLGSAWEAPVVSNRWNRTDHCCQRSGRLMIESAEAD